jgi:hypothetical protein
VVRECAFGNRGAKESLILSLSLTHTLAHALSTNTRFQAQVDPMYQYSLAHFTKLFNQCLEDSEPADELPQRLINLLDYTTEFMYRMVCRWDR